jgi:Uma2 family endonuclease
MSAGPNAILDPVSGAPKRATYQDVLDAPEHVVAELIDGVLYTQARPRRRHSTVATGLGALLYGEYQDGLGRRGGWIFLDEPELHLGDDVLVPDVAAWRTERYDHDHDPDTIGHTVPPDWVCEVLSPSTARLDRGVKLPLYARAGMTWAWLADPAQRTLEVYRRAEPLWQLVATHAQPGPVALPPFDGFKLPLDALW